MSLEQARKIQRRNDRKLKEIVLRARHGDKKAALEVLSAMTQGIQKLEEVGYRVSSEDESPSRQLVLITKEWAEMQARRRKRRKEIVTALEERNYTIETFQSLLDELRNL